MGAACAGKEYQYRIADDLTGALDAAGPFAARGQPTFVVVKDDGCEPDQFADAATVSIDAGVPVASPVTEAVKRVRRIVERLCTPAGEICIKKIKFTLRGNVATETLAAMHALGRSNAIIVPAFPAQGRTVAGGMVHVNGLPLPQTGFAHDALSPCAACAAGTRVSGQPRRTRGSNWSRRTDRSSWRGRVRVCGCSWWTARPMPIWCARSRS